PSPAPPRAPSTQAPIDAERPQGKVLRVEVILQVEDAREPRAVPERIFPATVALLRLDQIPDAAIDSRSVAATCREEPEQRPRRLARDRFPTAGEVWIVVRRERLPPAAIAVLPALEPGDGAPHVILRGLLPDRREAAQHRPGAVD